MVTSQDLLDVTPAGLRDGCELDGLHAIGALLVDFDDTLPGPPGAGT